MNASRLRVSRADGDRRRAGGVLAFAVLRFVAAARDARRTWATAACETVFLSSALEDAITKLKAQERATAARAEASERLSGEIVASLTSGLIVVDRDGRVQIVNPAARRILVARRASSSTRLPRRAARGAGARRRHRRIAARERAPILRRASRSTRRRHRCTSASPCRRSTAKRRAVRRDLPVHRSDHVVALEEQLRLKEALARLGELTAGLAHEFRNGLATIHGYGGLLDPAVAARTQYRPYVEGIRSETQALGEVVTNFLNFARPEPLTLAPVDLRVLIERAADDVPGGDASTCSGEFAHDRRRRSAAAAGVQQSVSQQRRSVQRRRAAPRTSASRGRDRSRRADGRRSTVRDNGPGIPAEAMPRMFQPFFTTRAGGTGLGLAIVQKVIVSHNGRISGGNRAGRRGDLPI